MFTKVKAVAVAALIAALIGLGTFVGGVDWGQFGSFGPAIGLGVGAAVAYATKELRGYGAGVPSLKDAENGSYGTDTYVGDDAVDNQKG